MGQQRWTDERAKRAAKRVLRPVLVPVRDALRSRLDRALRSHEVRSLREGATVLPHVVGSGLFPAGGFTPPDLLASVSERSAPFMASSVCSASDFFHPTYHERCAWIGERPFLQRKQWEWVYILHQIDSSGVLVPGSRGLGFGVGSEPLPSAFASRGARITATDAPDDAAFVADWRATGQHSADVTPLLRPAVVSDDVVRELVECRPCDMNAIDPDLTGYDFNWSSCCFEHLGSIDAGLDFVVEAVEKTLRPGGVAVHTTELNLSDAERTMESGVTVLFRQKDLRRLVERLEKRGHAVDPFVVPGPAHFLDLHVDVPPYSDVHLKLLLGEYVTTSVGLTIRRRV